MIGIYTLTSRGRITISRSIQILLRIVPGDKISFKISPGEKVIKIKKLQKLT